MLPEAKNFDALRKMEAEADSCYYGVLDEVILQNKKDFFFSALPSDPPKDPLGAVLSFLYALMLQECTHALEGAGLDPDAGLLHRDRCGDVSLAMDLMEEFRGVICDRLAISTINIKGLNAEHFERQEDGSVFLNKNGRKAILNAWQAKKKETLRHRTCRKRLRGGCFRIYRPFYWPDISAARLTPIRRFYGNKGGFFSAEPLLLPFGLLNFVKCI